MEGVQFSIDADTEDGFYVIVGEALTVYEQYEAAVADVQQKVSTETESFLAEVTIDSTDSDDVAISLEQVGWQQIIQDMTGLEGSK